MCIKVYKRFKELCILHNFGEPSGGCFQNHQLRHSRFNRQVRIETKEIPEFIEKICIFFNTYYFKHPSGIPNVTAGWGGWGGKKTKPISKPVS